MCDSLHRLKLNIKLWMRRQNVDIWWAGDVGLTTTAASSWALYTPSSYIVFSLTFKPKITWGNLNVDDVKWRTKSKICILIREVVCYTCGDDQLAQLASSFKTMFSWIRFSSSDVIKSFCTFYRKRLNRGKLFFVVPYLISFCHNVKHLKTFWDLRMKDERFTLCHQLAPS